MAHRVWLALAGVTLVVLLVTGGRPARAVRPLVLSSVGPGEVYLALGDSLATGDEAPENTADEGNLPGYPVYLDRLLDHTQPISLTLLARSSNESTTSMLTSGGQLDQAVAFIRAQRAAGKVVSPVTLSIGGNDLVNTFLGREEPQRTITDTLPLVRDNLAQILDTLLVALTEDGHRTGDLIIMNYYNPYPDLTIRTTPPFVFLPPGQEPIVTDVEVPRFNQIVAEIAAARDVPVVDAFSRFRGREASLLFVRFPYDFNDTAHLLRNFDYHPRAAGHWNLAYGFLEAGGYGPAPRVFVPLMGHQAMFPSHLCQGPCGYAAP
ncbi:MAG: SGNH/GDSL hydrolase family protein [Chloroflexaceae bacterium]